MTFNEAFRQARQQGLREFTWGKGKYNTKMRTGTNPDGSPKVETDDEWAAALSKNKPAQAGMSFTPGKLSDDGKFTPTGPAQDTFDKSMLTPKKQEPVVDQPDPFQPGTYNTSMIFNKGNIRANRGKYYSNVNELWDYMDKNANSSEAQLFNNVLGGLQGDDKKKAFMQMMDKYKVKGNLGRRDSGRLANLFNDLSAIGTEGSDARKNFMGAYNNAYNEQVKTGVQQDPNAQRQMAMQNMMVGNAGASTLGDAGAGTMNNQKQLKYADK